MPEEDAKFGDVHTVAECVSYLDGLPAGTPRA